MTTGAVTCPLCSGTDYEEVYDLTVARSPDDLPGLVVRCLSCPMWFKLLLDPNDIPKTYPGEFGQDEVATGYLASHTARTLFHEALAKVKLTSSTSQPRLLDLGAAQGVLIEEAMRMGFDAEGVDHCEPNVDAARAKGLKVRLGAAEDIDDREMFDVITMMDIIEHVPDPMRLLAAAHRALKTGGEVVVYTPNHRAVIVVLSRLLHVLGIHYPVHEIFGRNHVCFFDDRSLPLALRKAGFDVRVQQQLPYDPSRPGQYVSPMNLLVITIAERLGKPLNRAFRLLVHARKAEGQTDDPAMRAAGERQGRHSGLPLRKAT